MKPISINLAGRPFYNRTLYLVSYGVSIVALVVMTILNIVTFSADQVTLGRIADAKESMRTEMAELDRRENQIREELEAYRLPRLGREVGFTRDALLQRYFSWTVLFNRLEEVMPYDVKLQSIRPSIQDDHIQIFVTGVSKNPEAFTVFEERLIASPLFADVYPQSELWEGERIGLSFNLSFRYLPGGPEEEGGAAQAAAAGREARTEPGGRG